MTTPTSPLRRPAGRYDEPKPLSRRTLIAGGTVLVLGLVAFAVFGYQYYSGSRTQFTYTGYKIVSDHAIEVDWQVTKERGDTIECLLQARDRINAEVGSLVVTIGPDDAGTVNERATIPTKARAFGAEVLSCRPTS